MYKLKNLLIVFFLFSTVIAFYYFQEDKFSPFIGRKSVAFNIPKDKITKSTLKNGMTVLVMKDETVPKVLMQIAYNVGSSVEQSGEKGMAHLVEHMIFKGTDKLSESDIDTIGRKYGASLNAFTSQDVTSYYFEMDSNNWKPFMLILADCMENAKFDSQHLASEVKAVISELQMRRDKYTLVMWEEAQKTLFHSNHPYHFPIIGFKEDLLNLTSDKLKAFYKKYYHPDKATLFVVGNVDPEEIIKEAKDKFESINSTSHSMDEPVMTTDLVSHKSVIYRDVKQPLIGMFWRVPGSKEKKNEYIESLESVLGAGEGSRLYKRLVEQDKIADSVGVSANIAQHGSILYIIARPKGGKIQECREAIVDEINKLNQDGATSGELHKVIDTKKRHFFENMEDYGNFVYDWIESYFATWDELDIFKSVNRLNDVTSDSLKEFSNQFLDPMIACEIQLLPVPADKVHILTKMQKYEDDLDKKILSKQVRTTPHEEPVFANTLPNPEKLEFTFPKPDKEFVLSNGIKVILHKNDRWPIVDFRLNFRDSEFFCEARDGFTINLLMDTLMEGSVGFTKDDHVKFFEGHAADYGFGASGVHLKMLASSQDEIFRRVMHILAKPTFPESELEKLKAINISRLENCKEDARSIAIRTLKNIVYGDHPYTWTFDDAIKLVGDTNVSTLKLAHKKYITPKGMVMTVVGNFDLDEMQKSITNVFSKLEGEEYKPVEANDKVAAHKPQEIDHFLLRDQVAFLMGQPSSVNIYNPDLIPLKILNIACFMSLGSRIYKIREATGLFYTAAGSFASGASKELGYDYLFTILSLENLDETEKLMKNVVADVAKGGITQEELYIARRIYMKALIDLSDSNSSISSTFSKIESLKLGFDYYDKALSRVQSMTLDEINMVAKKYFNADKMHRVRVGRVGVATKNNMNQKAV